MNVPDELCADMILMNGVVITVDEKDTIAEAVAIKDGKILIVGKNEYVMRASGSKTKVIDLKGMALLPGFIDAHNHLSLAAADYVGVDCSPDSVHSIKEMMERIAEEAKTKPKDVWIRGVNYDDARLEEKRHPTRWDIDEAVNDHPVILIHRGYHIAVVNSLGLKMLGITEDTPSPPGGEYGRDPATGKLNGILYENAWFDLWGKEHSPLTIDERDFMRGVKAMCEMYVKAGITSINDPWILPSNLRALQEGVRRGEIPIRINMHIIHTYLEELRRLGIKRGFGNDRLKIMAVKAVLDGSVSGLTAALYDPYLHKPDDRGILLMSKEELKEIIYKIHTSGLQVSIHANGDKALDILLDVYEEVLREHPMEDHRHRIEHCSLLNPERIERIKKLGLVPVIFAAYPYYHGDKIIPAFGPERVKWLMACRSLLDAGIKVAGHSDYPASPYNPLLGIHSVVNRRTEKGLPFSPEQAVTVKEAIRMYTINAAYTSFDENVKGSIEPGKFADLVVLEKNPLEVSKEEIKDIKVAMTIVDGKIVYQDPELFKKQ